MKKKLCVFLLMFVSIASFGQVIPKGTRFIGGNLNLDSYSSKGSNDTKINLNVISLMPSITYFKKDNFAITYLLGYGVSLNNSTLGSNDAKRKETGQTISAGLYFTNYKMLSDKLGISVQYGATASYFTTRITYKTNQTSTKSDPINGGSLAFAAGPGIIYLLNEKFALEGNASIINLGVRYNGNADDNTFQVSTNLSGAPGLNIGFRYFLK